MPITEDRGTEPCGSGPKGDDGPARDGPQKPGRAVFELVFGLSDVDRLFDRPNPQQGGDEKQGKT